MTVRDPDDPSLAQPEPPRVPPTISTTPTAIAMIVAGLGVWLAGIIAPGWHIETLLLGAAMTAAGTFELLR